MYHLGHPDNKTQLLFPVLARKDNSFLGLMCLSEGYGCFDRIIKKILKANQDEDASWHENVEILPSACLHLVVLSVFIQKKYFFA